MFIIIPERNVPEKKTKWKLEISKYFLILINHNWYNDQNVLYVVV